MNSTDTAIRLESRKRIIRKAALIFLLIIILLTFFSKTINEFLMAEVDCQSASSGTLQTGIETKGMIKSMNVEKIFAYGSWDITDVMVKEGIEVAKGTVLATVEAEDINFNAKTRELEIIKMENALQKYRDSFDPDSYRNEISRLSNALEKAQKELEQTAAMFESGAETRKAVDDAQDRLDNAKNNYETRLKEFDRLKTDYQRTLKEKELEFQLKQLEYENVMKKMPQDGSITAPVDGIVKTIGIEKGMTCNAGQTIFEIGRKSSSVSAEWQMNAEKASALNVGDKVRFKIKSLGNSSVEGKVKEKQYSINTGMYRFTSDISVEGSSPEDGSEVEISATKQSANYRLIVPNSSISGQEGKKYVFVVKERNGILGKENYVTMVDVKVEDSDDFNSAISGTIDGEDEIVIFSSKALVDGAQVKLR